MSTIKKIALMTSGGDAPGLNAAIRAVVRTANFYGLAVTGVQRGYEGMMDADFVELNAASVGNIIHRGGTILKSSRSEKFKTPGGREQAFRSLKNAGIDALIIIGGDGSFAGARSFLSEHDFPSVGIPKTIDNDLYGTDFTIGYDTAVNTAMWAIDRIRDTAESHNRLFFVEVMGRDAGFIALQTGIGVGAEAILVPETRTDLNHLMDVLEKGWNRKKNSMIIVVAEGEEEGGAFTIAGKVKKRFPDYDFRVSILGHIQRGGSPTCADRVLASKLGSAAVEALMNGRTNVMVGEINKEIAFTPFEKAVKHNMEVNPAMHRLMHILSS
jgi:6-phosphofructokinase 1